MDVPTREENAFASGDVKEKCWPCLVTEQESLSMFGAAVLVGSGVSLGV